MPKLIFLVLLLSPLALACNSDDSNNDGGSDVSSDTPDLCDLNAYIASGGTGHVCPHASSRICFEVCDAGGGSMCQDNDAGVPIWIELPLPQACIVCNTSPDVDAACPDAGSDAAVVDASSDAPAEAADAAAD